MCLKLYASISQSHKLSNLLLVLRTKPTNNKKSLFRPSRKLMNGQYICAHSTLSIYLCSLTAGPPGPCRFICVVWWLPNQSLNPNPGNIVRILQTSKTAEGEFAMVTSAHLWLVLGATGPHIRPHGVAHLSRDAWQVHLVATTRQQLEDTDDESDSAKPIVKGWLPQRHLCIFINGRSAKCVCGRDCLQHSCLIVPVWPNALLSGAGVAECMCTPSCLCGRMHVHSCLVVI